MQGGSMGPIYALQLSINEKYQNCYKLNNQQSLIKK